LRLLVVTGDSSSSGIILITPCVIVSGAVGSG
jgi:hypothetical protein